MMMNEDREYFRRRAAQELAAAKTTSNRIAANIHRELAERFLERADGDAAGDPAQPQAGAAQ